ncbi:hypothetical protein RSSM_01632 [Rhodopirellula sallentina SM41]|uniref:Uncharacterized protein n=1 Tax=Rhodopirellula sallentina SM41 TaxID=1263870 RepID=M5UGI1_9BACT|nr:hypothetical protein RSSM_01632 [Rhodopirellula sallentina SM41]
MDSLRRTMRSPSTNSAAIHRKRSRLSETGPCTEKNAGPNTVPRTKIAITDDNTRIRTASGASQGSAAIEKINASQNMPKPTSRTPQCTKNESALKNSPTQEIMSTHFYLLCRL